jgi:hypothetical protein
MTSGNIYSAQRYMNIGKFILGMVALIELLLIPISEYPILPIMLFWATITITFCFVDVAQNGEVRE